MLGMQKPGFFSRLRRALRLAPRDERPPFGVPFVSSINTADWPEILSAYRNDSPWLRSIVSTIAMSVAMAEMRVYRPRRQDDDSLMEVARRGLSARQPVLKTAFVNNELEEVSSLHPLVQLLNGVNTTMSGFMLMYITQVYQELVGEAFWYLERNRVGSPVSAIPVPPSTVIQVPVQKGDKYVMNVRGKLYEANYEDMLYFKWPDPLAPLGRGSGIGDALRMEVSSDRSAGKMIARRFASQAVPPVIMSISGTSDSELRNLKRYWLEEAHALWVAGVPFLINKDFNAVEVGGNFQSLQFAELRQIQRDVFINAFGIPPEIIGHQKNANRSTISAAEYLYNKLRILPRLEANRQVLQNQLATQYGRAKLIIDYENPVDEDKEFQLRALAQNPDSVTIDEWRTRVQGLPPLGGRLGSSLLLRNNRVVMNIDDLESGQTQQANGKINGNGVDDEWVLGDEDGDTPPVRIN